MAGGRGHFARTLAERQRDPAGRRWVFVPYDQLTDAVGPLSREDPAELGIVVVENAWKASRRPYHRQKLALVLANLRHFALEQAARGVAVRHVVADGPYRGSLGPLAEELGARHPLRTMRLAALMNLHRILPRQVVEEAASLDVPLASREGFVRQVLGWREFVRHVHEATDGFRRQPEGEPAVARQPGDGGRARWSKSRWRRGRTPSGLDGGALCSHLGSDHPLPPAFWGTASGLACLDRVVADVWREAYGHHITRLMVLGNLATLLDLSPRELTDWFWCAYADAFDWVVEPNVLGMATFAAGELMTTKPYVSGAAYIHRMSDYCGECAFDPRSDCPITSLYWAFLARHADELRDNARLRMPLASLRKRSAGKRRRDAAVFEEVRASLSAGEPLAPPKARS